MRELQKINTSDLSLGMRFSAPVFFDDGENMFLAEGKPLKEYHLDALLRWKQTYVVTYGQILDENALPDLNDAVDEELEELEEIEELEELEELEDVDAEETLEQLDSMEMPENPSFSANSPLVYRVEDGGFETTYQHLIGISKRFYNTYENGGTLSRTTIDQAAETIATIIETDAQNAVVWILNKGSGSTFADQAVDGAFLCAAVAKKMGIPQRKILQIIQAVLIHDVAMVRVPSEIRKKTGALTTEEFELLKMHTVRSGRICNDQLMFPREVSEIVLSHHEKWDGSGYPEGRRGDEIDIGALIVAVVDAFESMTSDKAYRDPISGYETVHRILADSGRLFSSMVVKAFVQTLGVYPVGSYVQLSDGAVCKVLETTEDSLFLPVVSLVRKGNGATAKMAENDVIRLNQQRQLFVAKAVHAPEK
ncbi:MAG: HD-GYP domain-containing protein [Treponemataceae bacterium]|nr:HD-GYP domain-containing protein [Treponemataceae bacterium]